MSKIEQVYEYIDIKIKQSTDTFIKSGYVDGHIFYEKNELLRQLRQSLSELEPYLKTEKDELFEELGKTTLLLYEQDIKNDIEDENLYADNEIKIIKKLKEWENGK